MPPAADNLSARADGEGTDDERAATSLGAPPNWSPTKTRAWGSSSGCQPGTERICRSIAWNLACAERPEKSKLDPTSRDTSRRTSQTDQKSSVLRFISQAALSIRGRNPRPGSPCTQICHVRNSRRDSRAALAWGVLHLAWAVGFRAPCCRALLPFFTGEFFYPEFRFAQYCLGSLRKTLSAKCCLRHQFTRLLPLGSLLLLSLCPLPERHALAAPQRSSR